MAVRSLLAVLVLVPAAALAILLGFHAPQGLQHHKKHSEESLKKLRSDIAQRERAKFGL